MIYHIVIVSLITRDRRGYEMRYPDRRITHSRPRLRGSYGIALWRVEPTLSTTDKPSNAAINFILALENLSSPAVKDCMSDVSCPLPSTY
ncbi:hypothetical protein EVAR_47970_1 [Eumeta japonica]|uniref:Uncharacterized protein n=1 Tax=Eumeta variegata TaxID=151549 RepID=A0A4C1X6L5_EUMVA|nr:hypothetical protein EVAR_47970_1 [Eumeta japonica]